MYRLDLDRPEVILPVPIYDLSSIGAEGVVASKEGLSPEMAAPEVAFFAPERPGRTGLVPVGWTAAACGTPELAAGDSVIDPLFYGHPADAELDNVDLLPVYSFTSAEDGSIVLSTEEALDGFERAEDPLALVWESPYALRFPVTDYLSDTRVSVGSDQCLTGDSEGVGTPAPLEASTVAPDDDPFVSWEWSWEDGEASGEQVEAYFAEGTHAVELLATTASGVVRTDRLVIEVAPGEPLSCSMGSESASGTPQALLLSLLLLAPLARRRRSALSQARRA